MEATSGRRAAAKGLPVALGSANAAGHAPDPHARFWRLDRALHACAVLAATLRGARGRGALLVR